MLKYTEGSFPFFKTEAQGFLGIVTGLFVSSLGGIFLKSYESSPIESGGGYENRANLYFVAILSVSAQCFVLSIYIVYSLSVIFI